MMRRGSDNDQDDHYDHDDEELQDYADHSGDDYNDDYKEKDPVPRFCSLPKRIGRCRAAFPRFYYHKVTSELCQFSLTITLEIKLYLLTYLLTYCVKTDQDTILPSILRQPIDVNKAKIQTKKCPN